MAPFISAPTTAAAFRAAAPSFTDSDLFPDESIIFWLAAAGILLNAGRWGSAYGLATILFVEHNLALEAMAEEGAAAGGIPGLSRGIVSSEAAKSVSVSYDTGGASELNAGHWNLTSFGLRLIRMVMLFGAGPVQIGVGFSPSPFFASTILNGWSAWGPGWRVEDVSTGQIGSGTVDASNNAVLLGAGQAFPAYTPVVAINGLAYPADSGNTAKVALAIAQSQGVAGGAQVELQYAGEMTNTAWNWTANMPVYVGPGGTLTQSPPLVGFLQQVGSPVTPTVLLVDIQDPIFL